MKKLFAILLVACLALTACSPEVAPAASQSPLSPDLVFQTPEPWSAQEVMQGKEEFYAEQKPEYMDTTGEFMEYLAGLNEFWKMGHFVKGTYAGQTLVLVKMTCDGPCGSAYQRYAVDESTAQWILLKKYSDALSADYYAPLPSASEDAFYEIPALEVPKELNFYSDTILRLQDQVANWNPSFGMNGAETLPNKAEPFARLFFKDGYVYGELPDGTLAQYSVTPKAFALGFNANLTLIFPDGSVEKNDYTLPCIKTHQAAEGEEAKLEAFATVDGVSLYTMTDGYYSDALPGSLVQALQDVHADYLMAAKDQSGKVPMSLDDLVSQHYVFFLKLDPNRYVLVHEKKLLPEEECG